jgi:hypothetical protein
MGRADAKYQRGSGGGGGALVGEHTPSMGAMGSGSSPGGALANVEKSKQR